MRPVAAEALAPCVRCNTSISYATVHLVALWSTVAFASAYCFLPLPALLPDLGRPAFDLPPARPPAWPGLVAFPIIPDALARVLPYLLRAQKVSCADAPAWAGGADVCGFVRGCFWLACVRACWLAGLTLALAPPPAAPLLPGAEKSVFSPPSPSPSSNTPVPPSTHIPPLTTQKSEYQLSIQEYTVIWTTQ